MAGIRRPPCRGHNSFADMSRHFELIYPLFDTFPKLLSGHVVLDAVLTGAGGLAFGFAAHLVVIAFQALAQLLQPFDFLGQRRDFLVGWATFFGSPVLPFGQRDNVQPADLTFS